MPRRETENRWRSAIGQEGEQTEGASREVREFDPYQAAERSARAQFKTFRERLGEDFETLRGRQAKAGRIRSGVGAEDQDRFLRDRLDRLDRAIATRAQNAAGQRLRQLGLLSRNRGRYMEALSGQLDRETAQENARKSMFSSLASGLLGAGGTAAGAMLGGPAGAAATS